MHRQRAFTLVEMAIVLVIIGLLIGGVLKGQELINSAKVKNYAADFRNIPLFIYGYQDKFRATPGDDLAVTQHLSGASQITTTGCGSSGCTGNGRLDGNWDSTTSTDETFLFWQHVRLAGLASGSTDTTAADYPMQNAGGGRIGIESGSNNYIKNASGNGFLPGTYVICSAGILGKLAKQLDVTLDDGNTQTGAVRIVNSAHTRGNAALANTAVDEATPVTVCMGV